MAESEEEQEGALLDLDGITVLLIDQPENPFQDDGIDKSIPEEEENMPPGPEAWLEE